MQRRDLDVNVTPMAFDYQGTKFLVGTSKECRLWLLDREALGGEDHRTPLYTSPLLCNDIQAFDAKGVWGSLAAWQDATRRAVGARAVLGAGEPGRSTRRSNTAGRRWAAWRRSSCEQVEGQVAADAGVAVARHGHGRRGDRRQRRGVRVRRRRGLDADRAGHARGTSRLRAAWAAGSTAAAERRIPGSRRAELVALDGQTGKELWSSGTQITSWNHFSGLTVANGRAYLGTFDGYMYCFGVK